MSEFIEVEWFGREHTIGIVLTYDEHDGFKARMAPVEIMGFDMEGRPVRPLFDDGQLEQYDIKWLMENAAKIPFEWAWGIFGRRMKSEWMRRHLKDAPGSLVRYDGVNYDSKNWERLQ